MRAYGKRKLYIKEFVKGLEEGGNASFTYEVANRWLGLRLDIIAVLFISLVAIFCLVFKSRISSEDLAYILTIVTDVVPFISYSLRTYADM